MASRGALPCVGFAGSVPLDLPVPYLVVVEMSRRVERTGRVVAAGPGPVCPCAFGVSSRQVEVAAGPVAGASVWRAPRIDSNRQGRSRRDKPGSTRSKASPRTSAKGTTTCPSTCKAKQASPQNLGRPVGQSSHAKSCSRLSGCSNRRFQDSIFGVKRVVGSARCVQEDGERMKQRVPGRCLYRCDSNRRWMRDA